MAEFLGLAGSKFKVRVSSICRGPPPGVVGTVGVGMGTGNEREGGGIFFTADLCRHLSHWRFSKVCILLIVPVGQKGQQFQDFEVSNKIKTYKGCFLSIMVNTKFRIFIKNLRNTYGLHFTNS